ncbi:MAG: class I SAM-dependent methyltransferase [Rubrobacter sp.]|nr:class I SAM-dependent methyltransferase [Rubrobacter sp.]
MAQLWGGPGQYIVVRTRFFDDFLLHSCLSDGIRQIVLAAARWMPEPSAKTGRRRLDSTN